VWKKFVSSWQKQRLAASIKIVEMSTAPSSSTGVSTTAAEDNRQGKGSKREDKGRKGMIGIKREKMGINIKHSIAYVETSTVTLRDLT